MERGSRKGAKWAPTQETSNLKSSAPCRLAKTSLSCSTVHACGCGLSGSALALLAVVFLALFFWFSSFPVGAPTRRPAFQQVSLA